VQTISPFRPKAKKRYVIFSHAHQSHYWSLAEQVREQKLRKRLDGSAQHNGGKYTASVATSLEKRYAVHYETARTNDLDIFYRDASPQDASGSACTALEIAIFRWT